MSEFCFLIYTGLPYITGLWGWQGGQATESSGNSGSPATHPVPMAPNPGGPPTQELSDMMMQMLDQNPSSFDDLNMFNTPFE